MNFTGDEGLSLEVKGSVVDMFGKQNNLDGNFNVCGTPNATSNNVIVRKPSVCQGNTVELDSFGSTTTDCE